MTASFKNSSMVDVRYINLNRRRRNNFGKCWRGTINHIIGAHDLRARLGTFSTPWRAPSNPMYAAPNFQFNSSTLSELLNRRAMQLLEISTSQQKKVMVLWSGGIDSTTVLSSLIKNWTAQDLKNLTVVMSPNSIIENIEFYQKFISNKLDCLHYSKLDITDEILSKNIIIHGDPADCLYGPSTPAYRSLIDSGQHLEPYEKHLDRMAEIIQPASSAPHYVEGFGKWWVNKVTDNLREVNPENVTTVADWWWWTYYNFKWEFSCQRPFTFNRKDFKKGISTENLQSFANTTFYNTPEFQNWSYTNLKNLIGKDLSTHKIEARRYIYDLDKNEMYFKNKTKMAGAPANSVVRGTSDLPLVYDNNWVGYYRWEGSLDEESFYLLETYQG